MLQELRPDYVTKFALITENYVPTGSNTKQKRKRNVCAKLARHKNLEKEINAIREKFSNWREELPPLLETKKKDRGDKAETNAVDEGQENGRHVQKAEDDEVSHEVHATDESSDEANEESLQEHSDAEIKEAGDSVDEEAKEPKKLTVKSSDVKKTVNKPSDAVNLTDKPKELNTKTRKKKRKKSEDEENVAEEKVEVEKVEEKPAEEKMDDPFFIGKKIIVPKLLQFGNENNPENEEFRRKRKLSRDVEAEMKPKRKEKTRNQKDVEKPGFRGRQELTEDELHPSWKAKKIQMIRPFEGKKIKFDE